MENKDIFLEGLKAEMESLISNCRGTLDVMLVQVMRDGCRDRNEYAEKIDSVQRNLTQLDYLKSDFVDLYYSRDPDFELGLELMNVSEQLELVRTSNQQLVLEKSWKSRILLESDKPLYANINPGYFYSVCSNIIGNLYYYSEEKKDIHIHVTEDRSIEIYMEGVALPEMVEALIGEYGASAQVHRLSVGTYGLLFAVQFCQAMKWRLTLEKTDSGTKVILWAPAIQVSVSPKENLASDMARRIQQQGIATLRARRAFMGMFAE